MASVPKALLQLSLRGFVIRVLALQLLTVASPADKACELTISLAALLSDSNWLLVDQFVENREHGTIGKVFEFEVRQE
jgi:hypothetical protein